MRLIVLVLLLWYVGLLGFLGVIVNSIIFYGIIIIGFVSFLKNRANVDKGYVLILLLLCLFYPLLASYKSMIVFGQPIIMGLASLRYLWLIFVGFLLVNCEYQYKTLIKQINAINMVVTIIGLSVMFIFNGDHNFFSFLLYSTKGDELNIIQDDFKGAKFGAFTSLIYVSLVYYLLKFVKNPYKFKNVFFFVYFIIYLLFVLKARQTIGAIAILYAFWFIRKNQFTVKQMLLLLVPILLVCVLVIYNQNLINSFLITFNDNNTDASSNIRTLEKVQITPYILNNVLLGVGNLSAQYGDGGFQSYFSYQFYVSDLGIWGAIFTGGLFLIFVYVCLYCKVYKSIGRVYNDDSKMFLYSILIYYIVVLFMYMDPLRESCSFAFSIMFFPLFYNTKNSYSQLLKL